MQALLDFLLSFAEISQTTLRLVGRSFMKVYSRKDLLSHIERCEGKFPPEIVLDVELKKVPLISFFLRSLIMPMDIVVLFQFPHPQNTFVSINMLLLFDREFKDSFVPLYLEEFPRIYKNTCKHLLDNYSAFIEFVIEVQYCEVDRDPYVEENELLRETLLKLGFAMPDEVHFEETTEQMGRLSLPSSIRSSHRLVHGGEATVCLRHVHQFASLPVVPCR